MVLVRFILVPPDHYEEMREIENYTTQPSPWKSWKCNSLKFRIQAADDIQPTSTSPSPLTPSPNSPIPLHILSLPTPSFPPFPFLPLPPPSFPPLSLPPPPLSSPFPFFHTLPSTLSLPSSNLFFSFRLNFPLSPFPFLPPNPTAPFNSTMPFFLASTFSLSLSNQVRLGRLLISSSWSSKFSDFRTCISAPLNNRSSFSSFRISSTSVSNASTFAHHSSANAGSTTLETIFAPCAFAARTACFTILRSGSAAMVQARPRRPARAVRPTR